MTLKECNACKSNGFPNQQIDFVKNLDEKGIQKTNSFTGKPSWILINPDRTIHEHKKLAPVTNAANAYSGNEIPNVNMSESQKQSVNDNDSVSHSYTKDDLSLRQAEELAKQAYWKRKEDKYDKNIEEYKDHNMKLLNKTDDILLEIRYHTTLLQEIKDTQLDIRDLLRNLLNPNPTIKKASDLGEETTSEKDKILFAKQVEELRSNPRVIEQAPTKEKVDAFISELDKLAEQKTKESINKNDSIPT